jgi:hypothetical protein
MNKEIFPRIYCRVLLMAVAMLLGSSAGLAQTNSTNADRPAAARMRALNNSLLNLHGQMQAAGRSDVRNLRSQASTVIAERAAALAGLIQSDPHAALTFALSPELLADMAAKFPQSSSLLESHTTVTGNVRHWIADYSKSSRSGWRMNSGGQTLNLYFAGPEPSNLNSDELLQATGVLSGSQMAVETSTPVQSRSALSPGSDSGRVVASKELPHGLRWPAFAFLISGLVFGLGGEFRLSYKQALSWLKHLAIYGVVFALFVFTSTPSYAQNSCTTTGAQNTAVLMVNLPNGSLPAGVTQASLQDVFFATNTPGVSLDEFLRDASYGQTSATGGVFGPYNLTGTYSSCSDLGGAVLNDAIAAAIASGVSLNNYTRLFLIFPDIFGCGWQGFASVGSCSQSTPSGTFNLSVAYISAAYTMPRSSGVQLASHELGHNFGLLHSGTIAPAIATDILGPLGSVGTENDLGDYWSTMGEAVVGLYPASQKINTLGWMSNPANYQTITSSGTYTIQPLETSPAGLEVLKIQRGTGNSGYYLWVEYRQPMGNYDSTLITDCCMGGTSNFSGALVHYQDPTTDPAHSYLSNFAPGANLSPALAAGQTWTDPYTNLSLSVVSATSSGLTVNVNYGSVPCTPAGPTVTASPLDPSIYPGNSTSYGLTVTNNDSSGCSSNTFSLSSTQPSGWPTSFSSTSVTLSPGQSAAITMYKTGPSSTPPGTYAVNASATNNSYAGSGTANVTVMTAPALTVSAAVSGSSFGARSTVPITATVLNGGAPAPGASVTFTLTAPDGSTAVQSATTSSSGTATWSYRLGPKPLTGTYSVVAQAALSTGSKHSGSTQTATSNTVSFIVQ